MSIVHSSQRWDSEYQSGRWDFLHSMQEAARFGIVAGWIHHMFDQVAVLDVGCGEGVFLRHLDPHRLTRYVGVDISETALARFSPRGVANVRTMCSALETFDADPGERFDAILFNEVLFHAGDPYAALHRYRQWLAPGGVMAVSFYQTPRATSGARRQTQDLWSALEQASWKVLDSVTLFNEDRNLFWRLRLVQAID
ncbi:MAG: class I SAM-dependent methyltransferase [Alphaproteobacteria bacterium]|nr:class I SAM-dependent methyltransferase [Alphaproteobacteria bacterium]